MGKISGVVLALLFLTAPVGAQQIIRLQGVDVPVQVVDEREVIRVEDCAEVFPGLKAEGVEYIELKRLVEHANARVTRRDGVITAIRFYNQSMGEIWDSVRGDQEPRPDRPSAAQATTYYPSSAPTTTSAPKGTLFRTQSYTQRGSHRVYWEKRDDDKRSRVEIIRQEVDGVRP